MVFSKPEGATQGHYYVPEGLLNTVDSVGRSY